MLSILAFGDIHIKPDNAVEITLLQEKILRQIDRIKPDLVCILGDVLDSHERVFTNCLNRAMEFFRVIKEKANLYVLVGNHDLINNKQFLTENHWMNTIKEWRGNITIVDKTTHLQIKDFNLIFVPYVEAGRFAEALDTIAYDWKDANLIFAHQEFKGCVMNEIKSENGDVWSEKYPQIISGHIHINQTIGNIYYPGSVIQTSFGEKCSNVVAHITIGKEIEINEILLKLPRQETIELNLEDVDNYDFDELKAKNISKLRLVLIGEPEGFTTFKHSQKYKELTNKSIKVLFSPIIAKKTKHKQEPTRPLLVVLKEIIGDDKDLQRLYTKIVE